MKLKARGWVSKFATGIYIIIDIKDTIYTKLALVPWIDDNLGHNLSGLTQIGNNCKNIFKIYYFSRWLKISPIAQLVER